MQGLISAPASSRAVDVTIPVLTGSDGVMYQFAVNDLPVVFLVAGASDGHLDKPSGQRSQASWGATCTVRFTGHG